MAVSGKAYVLMEMRQTRVIKIMGSLPDNSWQRLSTGARSKGEKYFDWLFILLTCVTKGFRKYFLVWRSLSHPDKLRGYVSCCRENTPLSEPVHVAGTRNVLCGNKRRRWLRPLRDPFLAGLVSSYHSGYVRTCTLICPKSEFTRYSSRVVFLN